jgi:hypothetical protein
MSTDPYILVLPLFDSFSPSFVYGVFIALLIMLWISTWWMKILAAETRRVRAAARSAGPPPAPELTVSSDEAAQ